MFINLFIYQNCIFAQKIYYKSFGMNNTALNIMEEMRKEIDVNDAILKVENLIYAAAIEKIKTNTQYSTHYIALVDKLFDICRLNIKFTPDKENIDTNVTHNPLQPNNEENQSVTVSISAQELHAAFLKLPDIEKNIIVELIYLEIDSFIRFCLNEYSSIIYSFSKNEKCKILNDITIMLVECSLKMPKSVPEDFRIQKLFKKENENDLFLPRLSCIIDDMIYIMFFRIFTELKNTGSFANYIKKLKTWEFNIEAGVYETYFTLLQTKMVHNIQMPSKLQEESAKKEENVFLLAFSRYDLIFMTIAILKGVICVEDYRNYMKLFRYQTLKIVEYIRTCGKKLKPLNCYIIFENGSIAEHIERYDEFVGSQSKNYVKNFHAYMCKVYEINASYEKWLIELLLNKKIKKR